MSEQVVNQNVDVNESAATLEEILFASIMRMQHVELPGIYVSNLIQTCGEMSIVDFLKMGFPMEVLSIVKAYSACKQNNALINNDSAIKFVVSQISHLPVAKSTRRRLV